MSTWRVYKVWLGYEDDIFSFQLQKSSEDKVEKLLTLLEDKTKKTLNVEMIPLFIRSLQQKYDWLYILLTEDVPDAVPSTTGYENGFKKLPSTGSMSEAFSDLSFSSSSGGRKFKVLLESGGVPCLPAVAVEREELVN